jgi:hypothetical protein
MVDTDRKVPLTVAQTDVDFSHLSPEEMVVAIRRACMEHLHSHLVEFLANTPSASYEDWVGAVHPENSKPDGIDPRFYLKGSEHRIMWNDAVEVQRRVSPNADLCEDSVESFMLSDVPEESMDEKAEGEKKEGKDDENQHAHVLTQHDHLMLATLESEIQVHPGTVCHQCGVTPIQGCRYKCAVCPDLDLCQQCEDQNVHPSSHVIMKIRLPLASTAGQVGSFCSSATHNVG